MESIIHVVVDIHVHVHKSELCGVARFVVELDILKFRSAF